MGGRVATGTGRPERLGGVGVAWCVVAGGVGAGSVPRMAVTETHGDLEIAVPAAGFAEVRDRFPEYAFDAVGSGRIWARAGVEVLAATHQTWVRDPASGRFLFDVFRKPHDGGDVDLPAGRQPGCRTTRSSSGTPTASLT